MLRSSFKDYYDFVLGYQGWQDVEWFREPQTVKLPPTEARALRDLMKARHFREKGGVHAQDSPIEAISFCSKLYLFLRGDNEKVHFLPFEGETLGITFLENFSETFRTGVVLDKIHQELNTPIFWVKPFQQWVDRVDVVINPHLAPLNFQTKIEASQAYQEVVTYLSVLSESQQPKPLPVSDSLRAKMAGFDPQSSFRGKR